MTYNAVLLKLAVTCFRSGQWHWSGESEWVGDDRGRDVTRVQGDHHHQHGRWQHLCGDGGVKFVLALITVNRTAEG